MPFSMSNLKGPEELTNSEASTFYNLHSIPIFLTQTRHANKVAVLLSISALPVYTVN